MSPDTQDRSEAPIDSSGEGTSRVEAFSDGVMAIAITLLILEIKVPHLEADGKQSLLEALLKLWPSYLGYLTSFLVIGIIWINHHQGYRFIARTTQSFLTLNVVFLMVVSFLPFPTGLLAEYLREGKEQTTAAVVYNGAMLATAIAYRSMWRYASANNRLLYANTPAELVKSINRMFNTGLLLYTVAFGVTFISYQAGLALTLLLAIYFLLPGLPSLPGLRRMG